MIKKFIVVMILILFTSVFLFPKNKKNEMWQKSITEKDVNLKFQYLKEYEVEFGKKKDRFTKFLYLNLVNTAFILKKYEEAIQYGEKAVTFVDLDEANKIQIYISLSNSYRITKTDIDKAYHYAGLTVELSKKLISTYENSTHSQETKEKYINNYNVFYLAPAYRLQALILFDKGKDNIDNLKEACQKASDAFRIDRSQKSSDMVFSFAINLYKKRSNNDAINAVELIFDKEKPEFKLTYLLANLYVKKDKIKAVEYFELAYKTNRKANIAMKIGQLIYKQNIDKGIKYLAEAYLLSNASKESNAYKYLENLYFNKKAKNKSPEEQERGFREIINAARERLDM